MSRAKPYTRDGKRDVESQWKHDMHDDRGSLAARLHGSTSSSSRTSRTASGSSLLGRMSGAGMELLPDSKPISKLHGFGEPPAARSNTSNANARELLPDKSARQARSSRPRGVVDPGQRNLVTNSINAALKPPAPRQVELISTRVSRASASPSPTLSIFGAAGVTCVRVEHLAQGTTAEDVKSAFAPTNILSARLCSNNRDRTATVEVEVSDRATAESLIEQFNGVIADGETLRLTIVRKQQDKPNGGRDRPSPTGLGARLAVSTSGKLYSDSISPSSASPRTATSEKSLAARLGGGNRGRW